MAIITSSSTTLNIPITQTVGGGITVPPGARILPQSTAKISHARILKGYRSKEDATLFHNIMRDE